MNEELIFFELILAIQHTYSNSFSLCHIISKTLFLIGAKPGIYLLIYL